MAEQNTSIVTSSTSAPLPKVPKYAKLIWQALKGVSSSAEIKMGWAVLIARQFDAYSAAANKATNFRCKAYARPEKAAFFYMAEHLAKAERLSCSAMCLKMHELEWLSYAIVGMLRGDFTAERLHEALENCKNSSPA